MALKSSRISSLRIKDFRKKALQLIRSYLGTSKVFTDIEIGIEYLRNVLDRVQKDIEATILSNDYITVIGQIYSIFDRTFRHYVKEKKDRGKIDHYQLIILNPLHFLQIK